MAKRNPEDFEVLYLQGLIAYQAGQVDQAKTFLNQFLAIQAQRAEAGASDVPDPTNVLLLLADIAEQQKQPDEAFALLGRIEDPEARLTAQLRQAVLRGQQGDVAAARELLRAIPATEDREIALVALTEAQVLRRAGQTAEVIGVLEAANKRLPDTPDVMYELAMLYEREGRTPEMESLLRRLIVLQPNHAHAFNALGYSLADRNERLDEARTLIEKALSLSPDDAFILDSMGWVYYRQGNNSQALYYLRRAYSIRQDTEIAVHLGEVLWVAGQRDEARSLWQDASRQEPANASLRATLARLGATL
jgi:tetratricopeptide (TPR) repeat protein